MTPDSVMHCTGGEGSTTQYGGWNAPSMHGFVVQRFDSPTLLSGDRSRIKRPQIVFCFFLFRYFVTLPTSRCCIRYSHPIFLLEQVVACSFLDAHALVFAFHFNKSHFFPSFILIVQKLFICYKCCTALQTQMCQNIFTHWNEWKCL